MSVDTYLKNKRTSEYQTVNQEGVQFLLAPVLVRNVKQMHLGLRKFLFWRSLFVQLEPIDDHIHSPS